MMHLLNYLVNSNYFGFITYRICEVDTDVYMATPQDRKALQFNNEAEEFYFSKVNGKWIADKPFWNEAAEQCGDGLQKALSEHKWRAEHGESFFEKLKKRQQQQ